MNRPSPPRPAPRSRHPATAVVAGGTVYFVIVFGAGFVLGVVRTLWLVPRLGVRWAELLEIPVMLLVIYWAARWVSRRFHLHVHSRPVQLGVGLVGLLLLLGGELGLALELGGQSPGEYLESRDLVSGTAYALSLLLFVIMPALVIPVEGRAPGKRAQSRGRRPGALAVSLVLFAWTARGQGAVVGGPLPGPLPLLPADDPWNATVAGAPVDPAADAVLDFIDRGRRLHPDFGGDAPDFPEIYGMPFVSVPGSQPRVPVIFTLFGDESDPGAPGEPPGYPIPPQARDQPKWIEGGYPAAADAPGDRHMLLVDRDRRILYELWLVRWNSAAARWEAGSGAVWPLDETRRRPEGWTSADAAGLAILPGLVRYDETFGDEPIRHAFRFTVRATDGHVFPASHTAGDTPGAPPLGTRLRLRADKDLSGYPAPVRRIFEAMKTYGLILADNGSDMFVQGAYDPRWDNDLLNPAFRSLTAGDFEVVELGWRPDASAPGPCVPGAEAACLQGGRFRVEVRWRTGSAAGEGRPLPITADTAAFWFFAEANLELVVKVLDGCGVNGRFWVFAAGLTNVEVTLEVTDTVTGARWSRRQPAGPAFPPVQATDAFLCGPA